MRRFLVVLLSGVLGFSLVRWATDATRHRSTAPMPAVEEIPLLEKINRENVRVSERVIPGVVNIMSVDVPSAKQRAKGEVEEIGESIGCALSIGRSGYLLTNAHVVKEDGSLIAVTHENRWFGVKVVGLDEPTDLAVLKIEGADLPLLVWADSNLVRVGEQVLAVGNPFGLEESVSSGIISGVGRNPENGPAGSYESFLQTSAAINPGNSGGALVNIRGELIGLNTAIFSQSGGSQGVGFAVPSNLARFVMESLIAHGRVVRGFLGVKLSDVGMNVAESTERHDLNGAYVDAVEAKTPAFVAGLREKDIILRYGDRLIRSSAQLRVWVAQTPVGQLIPLRVRRNGEELSLSVRVAELPPKTVEAGHKPGPSVLSGVKVRDITPETRAQFKLPTGLSGVVVEYVPESSPGFPQLKAGDVIQQARLAESSPALLIPHLREYQAFLQKLKPTDEVRLSVRHSNGVIAEVTLSPTVASLP
jgi:serine protease Do